MQAVEPLSPAASFRAFAGCVQCWGGQWGVRLLLLPFHLDFFQYSCTDTTNSPDRLKFHMWMRMHSLLLKFQIFMGPVKMSCIYAVL